MPHHGYWSKKDFDNAKWLENYRNAFFSVNVDIVVNNGNLFTRM